MAVGAWKRGEESEPRIVERDTAGRATPARKRVHRSLDLSRVDIALRHRDMMCAMH